MDAKDQTGRPGEAPSTDHEAHEQRLAAALRELVQQIDIGDYRDSLGHSMRNNMTFLKAQAVVDEFGVSHEQLCATLDDCDLSGDLADAARRIFELREVGPAQPDSTPPEYRTWTTGP